jgi:hypothetical protein
MLIILSKFSEVSSSIVEVPDTVPAKKHLFHFPSNIHRQWSEYGNLQNSFKLQHLRRYSVKLAYKNGYGYIIMNYKIRLKDGTTQIIDIIATTFKRMKVWKLSFSDGKDIMLYKVGSQWLQRKEDFLEQHYLILIGAYIDALQKK